MDSATNKKSAAINISDVNFTYPRSQSTALKDIQFSLNTGCFALLMGRTGSGKTSLMRIINRIIPSFYKGSFNGEVKLFQKDISGLQVSSLAKTVGMVFQDFESQLFSTNSLLDLAFGPENMGIPPDEIQTHMDRIIDVFDLKEIINRDPVTLSGGQKQRLAIASILMLDPPILVLDEPTTDLDPEGTEKVLEILRKLRGEGRTIILVDHSTEYAESADNLVLMNAGQIKANNSPDQLICDFDLLGVCGVRKPQIRECLTGLGLDPVTSDPVSAAHIIRTKGLSPNQEHYESLVFEETKNTCGNQLIKVKDLHFNYNGDTVIDGISLTIHQGDFLALIGQNGSGKTTLAKHFNGLLQPSGGKVTFLDKPVANFKTVDLARNIGYVFQNPDHQIFCPTVREEVIFGPINIGMSEEQANRNVLEAIETVGLEGLENHDPFLLTKGERQRVAVASILAMHPQVIILDEPTTGLDYIDQIRMMDLLVDLNKKGHTIIMITHSMSMTVEYANRAVVIHDGKILADDSVRNIFKDNEILLTASLKPPPVTLLGLEFGMVVQSVQEFVNLCLHRSIEK